MNPDRPDDLIVRTKSETYKVDYYMDQNNVITQLDYEGSPLRMYVKPKKLVTEEDADRAQSGAINPALVSPMPGRIVKVFA